MIRWLEIVGSILGLVIQLLPRLKGGDSGLLERVLATVQAATMTTASSAADLEALEAQLEAMVAEGRDPTEEEWEILSAKAESLHRAIQEIEF